MVQAAVTKTSVSSDHPSNYRAMAMVTTLFFMWGFLTALNDILVPHLKSIFELNYTRVMLIQSAFFGAYFVFAIPAGIGDREDRIQENDGGRFADHGGRGLALCARCQRTFLWALSGRAHRAGLRRDRAASGGQPLRHRAWPVAYGFQPSEPYPGVQFAGDHDCSVRRGTANFGCGPHVVEPARRNYPQRRCRLTVSRKPLR